MGDFQASVVLPRTREETFNYLRDPKNFMKLFPSVTKHVDARLPVILDRGSCLEFNFKAMGSQFQIVQEITELSQDERIVAKQLKGPFKLWIHEQRFADAADGGTLLTNSIRFDPPGGLLGFIVTRKQVMAQLEDWVGRGHALLLKTLSEESR